MGGSSSNMSKIVISLSATVMLMAAAWFVTGCGSPHSTHRQYGRPPAQRQIERQPSPTPAPAAPEAASPTAPQPEQDVHIEVE